MRARTHCGAPDQPDRGTAALERRRKPTGAADCSPIPNDAQTKNAHRRVAVGASFGGRRELLSKRRVFPGILAPLDDACCQFAVAVRLPLIRQCLRKYSCFTAQSFDSAALR